MKDNIDDGIDLELEKVKLSVVKDHLKKQGELINMIESGNHNSSLADLAKELTESINKMIEATDISSEEYAKYRS